MGFKIYYNNLLNFISKRHEIFQSTNQIAKETSVYLKQLSNIKTNNVILIFEILPTEKLLRIH